MVLSEMSELRRFWYPVIPISELKAGPKAFTLMNEALVLWIDSKGEPRAASDRCCHRSAQLSRGWIDERGNLTCPYHGWGYDGSGQCVVCPQLRTKEIPVHYKVNSFSCQQKYGYAWVCLGTPARGIPEIPEADLSEFRSFPCFYETWKTTSLRVVENELDMAHFAVVHRNTFGDPTTPLPLSFEVIDSDPFSLRVRAELSVVARGSQLKNTNSQTPQTTRFMDVTWIMPFFIRLHMTYPSGLVHVIINYPTPINDDHIQVVQFCYRSDKEEHVGRDEILAFERLILNEDRSILETTDPDVPFEMTREMHIPTDKPGILVRRKLKEFLAASKN